VVNETSSSFSVRRLRRLPALNPKIELIRRSALARRHKATTACLTCAGSRTATGDRKVDQKRTLAGLVQNPYKQTFEYPFRLTAARQNSHRTTTCLRQDAVRRRPPQHTQEALGDV